MTISNGSPILLADLSALTSAQLALIRADNAQLPLAFDWTVAFRAMRASGGVTSLAARTAFLVAPRDLWLDAMTLKTHGMNGTTAATLSTESAAGTLAFMSATVSIAGGGAGVTTNATRTLYDNTRASAKSAALTLNPAFRAVPKGQRMKVVLTTTNTLGSEYVWFTLVCREGYARP